MGSKPISKFGALFLLLASLFLANSLSAQNPNKLLREGNKNFKNEKYSDAEINYRKSLEKDPNSHKGNFNLGDALYKQQNYEHAAERFKSITESNVDDETKAKAFHNLGNSLMQSKKYQESIDAYKRSLKLQPNDLDTKYNLEYAKRMLVQQQQQQQQQNQDQNKQDKQQQQQQQQQQNQDQNKQDKQQQQAQGKEQKMSKEDAERLLQALSREEQALQKKLKRKPASKTKFEKNW